MYRCVVSDCGLSYQSEDLKDIVEKLHQYCKESFGSYSIRKDEEIFKNCLEIKSTGEYLIYAGRHGNIFCEIKQI